MVASDRLSAFDVVMPSRSRQGPRADAAGAALVRAPGPHRAEPPHRRRSRERRRADERDQVRGRSMLVKRLKPLADRGRRARLPGRQRLEGVPGERQGLRHPLPPGLKQRVEAAGADLHAGHQGRDRRTTRTSTSSAPARSSARSSRRGCATSRSASTARRRRSRCRGDHHRRHQVRVRPRCRRPLTLIDEVLTPDSSRFWPADLRRGHDSRASTSNTCATGWKAGSRRAWNKQPPAPPLPAQVVEETVARYRAAFEALA